MLGLYGGADTGHPRGHGRDDARGDQASAARTPEIIVYPDTPHGFNADYRPSYRPEAAKDGWARMLAWFKQNGLS